MKGGKGSFLHLLASYLMAQSGKKEDTEELHGKE